MRIAVYGATGMIGSRVVAEALARGIEVVGISRSGGGPAGPAGAAGTAGAESLLGDAGDAAFAKNVAADADVVVSAIGPSRTGGDRREFLAQLSTLVDTLGDARLVVVGGAGSLEVAGGRLVDQPGFPEIYRAEALIGAEALDFLRGLGADTDWTFLSPAPVIQPGERTGRYTLGADSPVGDAISAEDYAVALVDEIEQPAHARRRFTVAS